MNKDYHIHLAKEVIKEHILFQKRLDLPKNLPNEFYAQKAGVFISLHHKENKELLGCIGTFLPTKECLGEEIIDNAIAAASSDPRFLPVRKENLSSLHVSVDVLGALNMVKDIDQLNPKKYGIFVKTGDGRSALLLPDLVGVDTVEQQIHITCQKGGIDISEDIKIYRFKVNRHEEKY